VGRQAPAAPFADRAARIGPERHDMSKLSRRDFTRHVGLAALFAPFVTLRQRPARAQTAPKRATRFLLFFTNGTDPSLWSPTGSTETSIRHSAMTEGLAPLAANLTLIEKLSSLGTADNHAAPGGLTGLGYSGQRHTSVDVFIADRLRAAGVTTAIPNLLLGGVPTEQQTSFLRDGQRLSPIASPTAAFDAIFAGAAPGDGNASALLRRRKSTLDLLKGELAGLSRELGSDERRKLELHTASIREVERRLTGDGGGAATCAPPAEPSPAGQDLLNSAIHLDLAVTALACDITRVAAVQFGNHQSTQISIPEVGQPGDWHNSFIHGDNPRTRLTNLERWLCEQFVAAATKLRSLPDPDGDGTLFDSTLMVWARDMGDAVGHNGNDMRFVFSGGAGGYLRTSAGGRYLDGKGAAHQQALMTCCDAMGITDTAGFGDHNAPREPLAALAA
jgi:hypothetical protein